MRKKGSCFFANANINNQIFENRGSIPSPGLRTDLSSSSASYPRVIRLTRRAVPGIPEGWVQPKESLLGEGKARESEAVDESKGTAPKAMKQMSLNGVPRAKQWLLSFFNSLMAIPLLKGMALSLYP